MRLLKLLPSEQTKQSIREVKLGNSEFAVKIDDMAKYTMDVSIKQLSGMVKGITPLYLTVRLYNDAKVAEIIHHDYHQRIKPSYGYPNPKMHQKDEKYQLNALAIGLTSRVLWASLSTKVMVDVPSMIESVVSAASLWFAEALASRLFAKCFAP